MKKHDKPELRPYRKELRKNLTPAEAFLWKYLQKSKLDGKKFRRQHSVENFIVDFYCASENLIIELDGDMHNNSIAIEKDEIRDARLKALGFMVLRFENKMVFDHLDSVLCSIRENFTNTSR